MKWCNVLRAYRFALRTRSRTKRPSRSEESKAIFAISRSGCYVYLFLFSKKRHDTFGCAKYIKLTAHALSTVIMEYTNYVKVERLAYEQGVI